MGQRLRADLRAGRVPDGHHGRCPRTHIADRTHPRWEARLASVGVAQSAVEVMVADAQDRPLPPEEIGEVLVRGEAVMKGYWRNRRGHRRRRCATAGCIRATWDRSTPDGFLTLRDRSKDLIISGGSNIYPREVEEVLLRHPAVSEVSVVGRPHPEWGEEVVAFVVLRSGGQAPHGGTGCGCACSTSRASSGPKVYRYRGQLAQEQLRQGVEDGTARAVARGRARPSCCLAWRNRTIPHECGLSRPTKTGPGLWRTGLAVVTSAIFSSCRQAHRLCGRDVLRKRCTSAPATQVASPVPVRRLLHGTREGLLP